MRFSKAGISRTSRIPSIVPSTQDDQYRFVIAVTRFFLERSRSKASDWFWQIVLPVLTAGERDKSLRTRIACKALALFAWRNILGHEDLFQFEESSLASLLLDLKMPSDLKEFASWQALRDWAEESGESFEALPAVDYFYHKLMLNNLFGKLVAGIVGYTGSRHDYASEARKLQANSSSL